jgi:glutamate 5-kinase
MLAHKVIPIVNENDTISVTELMFTDNDELSGLIATMMGMQALVILSNIDGIFDGDPANPASQVIREVEPNKNLSQYIQTNKSAFGRGGMLTKTTIARKVAAEGITVIIANGKRDNILIDRNECEALVSSVNHSPLKRHEGRIILDKSSESLPFEEQAYNSTQLASSFMYLLWGEYNRLLPDSDLSRETPQGAGTYMS